MFYIFIIAINCVITIFEQWNALLKYKQFYNIIWTEIFALVLILILTLFFIPVFMYAYEWILLIQ